VPDGRVVVRLPRREDDPQGLVGAASDRFITAMIDGGGYWQCAALIAKGTDARRRAAGLERFMAVFAAAARAGQPYWRVTFLGRDGALEGPAERSCFNSPMLAPELSS
jgi:hypothetical protein